MLPTGNCSVCRPWLTVTSPGVAGASSRPRGPVPWLSRRVRSFSSMVVLLSGVGGAEEVADGEDIVRTDLSAAVPGRLGHCSPEQTERRGRFGGVLLLHEVQNGLDRTGGDGN